MGYTHFYPDLEPADALIRAAQELFNAAVSNGIVLTANGYDGLPIADSEEGVICFAGDEATGKNGEDFLLSKSTSICPKFTKTNRHPYDTVAAALLTYAIVYSIPGSETISSDGNIFSWANGIELYEQVFGPVSVPGFYRLLEQIGEPFMYDESNGKWRYWSEMGYPEITDENYWELVDMYENLYRG